MNTDQHRHQTNGMIGLLDQWINSTRQPINAIIQQAIDPVSHLNSSVVSIFRP